MKGVYEFHARTDDGGGSKTSNTYNCVSEEKTMNPSVKVDLDAIKSTEQHEDNSSVTPHSHAPPKPEPHPNPGMCVLIY